MQKYLFSLIAVLLCLGISPLQADINPKHPPTFPTSLTLEGSRLMIHGQGIRKKLWIKLYKAGLYTAENTQNSPKNLTENDTVLIRLEILSNLVSSKKMASSIDQGFKQSLAGNTTALKAKIEQFKGFFKEEITAGTVFDIIYLPSKGSMVKRNNEEVGTIKGLAFKKALFGIWLGHSPIDSKLKEALLKE